MAPISKKNILLIVGGGVAAYKSLELIRLLRQKDFFVRVILTAAGSQFVTPLSLAALSGSNVYDDLFSLTDEVEMGHIELSRQADLIVIAPATADLLAKAAHGLAPDMATTALLASDKPILAAPAMNVQMWLKPATQRNVAQLKQDGYHFVGPNEGMMACGEYGPGRMAEPAEILSAVENILEPQSATITGILAGRRVVVTAGPTHEPIDPVRYIANRSSGKQGYAIAAAAARAGADVLLISGPVACAPPAAVRMHYVETAREMLAAAQAAPADIFIAAAAVGDWRMADECGQKIKKGAGNPPTLILAENPDILKTIAMRGEGRPALVVGFAAETEQVLDHAQQKLIRKGCDVIVANDVSAASGIMGGDENEVRLVTKEGVESWPRLDKMEVANRLIQWCATRMQAHEQE